MAQFPLLPLLSPPCLPFVSPFTYLAPSSCDRNHPPPSQVACKLTLFAPPFTQLSHPLQIPRTPTAQRPTTTTSGIFRLLLSGTVSLHNCFAIFIDVILIICFTDFLAVSTHLLCCLSCPSCLSCYFFLSAWRSAHPVPPVLFWSCPPSPFSSHSGIR